MKNSYREFLTKLFELRWENLIHLPTENLRRHQHQAQRNFGVLKYHQRNPGGLGLNSGGHKPIPENSRSTPRPPHPASRSVLPTAYPPALAAFDFITQGRAVYSTVGRSNPATVVQASLLSLLGIKLKGTI